MTTLETLMEELADVGRDVVSRGLTLASGGNLSARLPGGEEFVVTGAGTYLDRLGTADFAVMNLAGEVLSGTIRPSSEWKLHQRTYLACPDVNSVIHVHPQVAVLLDALGHRIRFFTLDHAYYVKSVGTTPYHPNGSDELADTAAEQAKTHNCVIQGHHGCSAMGPDIAMAHRRALNLEQAAQATFQALQLGDHTSEFPREHWESLHHA